MNKYLYTIPFIFLALFSFNYTKASSDSCSYLLTESKNLQLGNRDNQGKDDVYKLQSCLKSLGYLSVNPTGFFGNLTLNAIKNFQRSKLLPVTGFFGPLTRNAILNDVNNYSPLNNVGTTTNIIATTSVTTDKNIITPLLTNVCTNCNSVRVGKHVSSKYTLSLSNGTNNYSLDDLDQDSSLEIANLTMSFTVSNTGNRDVFMSKDPFVALSTSSPTGGASSTAVQFVYVSPDPVSGDTGSSALIPNEYFPINYSGSYMIPVGQSRSFTYHYYLDNTNGTSGTKLFKIDSINYGISSSVPYGIGISVGIDDGLFVSIPLDNT